MTRREVRRRGLVELLRRYPETLPSHSSGGVGGGDGVLGMPVVWHSRSVQELERALAVVRVADGAGCRHVLARFCGERVLVRCRLRGGVLVGLPLRSEPVGVPVAVRGDSRHGFQLVSVVACTWPRWVDDAVVARGLEGLLDVYRGMPELPKEFVAA